MTPEQYDRWKDFGERLGFKMVFAGPFVRSSYMADLVNEKAGGEGCDTGISA